MSRPTPVSPAPEHAQHDALLVSQLAMGDDLDDRSRAAAERLVAGCGACASLASDLRAVSRAVATEPAPARRRDFRMHPEQAAELRGGAMSRFLGRLSLPRARAFAPAAAGVLSLGLLFMVAGTAWPDDRIEVVSQPAASTRSVEPSAVTESLEMEAAADATQLGDDTSADMPEGPAVDTAASPHPDDALSMLEMSDLAAKTFGAERSDVQAFDARVPTVDESPLAGAVSGMAAEEPSSAPGQELYASVPSGVPAPGESSIAASVVADSSAGTSAVDGETARDATAQAPPGGAIGGNGPDQALVLAGLALAVVGAALLILALLARRSADPLLR